MLDDLKKIKSLDKNNMLGSIGLAGKQAGQIWQMKNFLKIPAEYKKIKNVVVAGMGGSALGAHLIKTLFAKELSVPVEIVNDYHLPNYVNKETVVVVSSYSGGTAETVSCLLEARRKACKIVIISAGGELQELAQKYHYPAVIFSTENNLCGQPRIGLGYSVVGQLLIFSQLGLVKFTDSDITAFINTLNKYKQKFQATIPASKNPAKWLAQNFIDKMICLVASEHLLGNAHIGANQINENAKRLATYFAIPELNHHLLEGMFNPASNKDNVIVVFLKSKLYDKRVRQRYEITEKVLDKNKIKHLSYSLQEKTKLNQTAEALMLTSHASFYGAMLRNIDPSAIPFVDYFKKQMSR